MKAPKLPSDVHRFREDNKEIHPRLQIENDLIWSLLHHMEEKGFKLHSVFDGCVNRTEDKVEAMETVLGVDESVINFRRNGQGFCVWIALGNDGWDAIADASCTDKEGWNAALDSFDTGEPL